MILLRNEKVKNDSGDATCSGLGGSGAYRTSLNASRGKTRTSKYLSIQRYVATGLGCW